MSTPSLLFPMARFIALLTALLLSSYSFLTNAQPSPALQKRISQAIKNPANESNLDYTAFVNPFIGTGTSQNRIVLSGF